MEPELQKVFLAVLLIVLVGVFEEGFVQWAATVVVDDVFCRVHLIIGDGVPEPFQMDT